MLRAVDEFEDGFVAKVAESILRKNEVVAVIDAAIGLDDGAVGTGLAQRADTRHLAHPIRQCRVEQLHEKPSDIAPHPKVEHFTEEFSPLLRPHGIGHQLATAIEAWQFGKTFLAPPSSFLENSSFHYRRKLQELATDFAEKLVEFAGLLDIRTVHRRQRVPIDPVFVEQIDAAHHVVEG